ncbi:uncharacterized protein B0P05DRAFT_551845 [Gilbertella persicaria]|uniref:uncharacterized protein n=1 Tax=Gilbertella persicaria TaxID=101096 RepID=UPI00221EBC25|nr:uncharacterized protein B0P05DRAFT_551845 [Gilbertella persicaria]KAI8068118.1 hypothetical protein B0P05DRAFT_551845 [Gilbertella persicaria]
MAVSLLAYVVTLFVFLCNYGLTLSSILFPKWLTFVTPVPFYMETNYGLFKLCRSLTRECRSFPSVDHGDCQEDGFCELWRAASAGMILSAVVGALAIMALFVTLCSQRRKRSKAWAPISFLFILYALPQALSMGIIAYLFNSSATFYMGTRYNISFIFCIISWILSVILAIVLCLVAILSPPEYVYHALD